MKKNEETYPVEHSINEALYHICLLVTFIAVAMSLIRFFTRGEYPPGEINIFYIGVLALYSLHKEALHWLLEKEDLVNRRKGEYFVYLWLLLATGLYAINFFVKDRFTIDIQGRPLETLQEISFIALEVGGIFVASRFAKIVRLFVARRMDATVGSSDPSGDGRRATALRARTIQKRK